MSREAKHTEFVPGRAPRARLVILGASNVARGLAAAVAAGRAAARARGAEAPPRLFIACGRGRSYVDRSMFLGRCLPSILDCGLWSALDVLEPTVTEPPGPLCALLTDLGNDLAYGVSVERLLAGVAEIVARLQRPSQAADAGTRPVVATSLPLASLERVPVAWLGAVQRMFFPGSDLEVPELVRRAHAFDAQFRAWCEAQGVVHVEQPAAWYGADPIHHRRSLRAQIWSQILSAWQLEAGTPARAPSLSLTDRLRVCAAWPSRSHIVGTRVARRQPAATLADGTEISLF